MVQNHGNAIAYAGARTHRPLPVAPEQGYRAAHQHRDAKPASTFDWDWNKATCISCHTTVTKASLVNGVCGTCRGETTPAPAPAPTKAGLEHSASGEHVFEHFDDHDLETRYQAPASIPVDPDPEPEPPARPTHQQQLLRHQLDHTTATLTRAHDITDPMVGLLRTSVLASIAALDLYLERHHPDHPASPASPGLGGDQPAADPQGEGGQQPARPKTSQKTKSGRVDGRRNNGPQRIKLPGPEIVEAYERGQTLAQIAAQHGVSGPTIARCLDDHGVARRGAPVKHTPELIDDVRRLYLEEGLTKVEVAARIGHSAKVVEHVMAAHGIPSRPAVARKPVDHSIGLRQRIAELGTSSREIKTWALDHGLIDHVAVGLPARRLVDAYEAAHPNQEEGPDQ
jgi:hypothetical protein